MKTIGVMAQKGGVGKTTTAIELAYDLMKKGKRVLLVDCDMQMNTSQYLEADTTSKSIYQGLELVKDEKEINPEDYIQHINGYDIIASSEDMTRIERLLQIGDDFVLADFFDAFSDIYDYIIFDSNPSKTMFMAIMLIAADYIVAPTDVDSGAFNGVLGIKKDLDKLARMGRANAKIIGVILTRFENTNMHSDLEETIKDWIGENEIIYTHITKSIAVSECKDIQQTIGQYKPSSSPARQYRDFTDKVLAIMEKDGE